MKKFFPGKGGFLKYITLCVIVLLLFYVTLPHVAHADASVRYAVQPIYPENQRPDKPGHFNLAVSSGQQQELHVEVQNLGDHTAYIEVSANAAYTNSNGILEYAPSAANLAALLSSNEFPFSDIITIENPLLTIAPGETETAIFMLRLPNVPFPGVLLGGLHFVESLEMQSKHLQEEGATESIAGGTGVSNRMAYAIPIVLRENETVAPPSFSLASICFDSQYADALRLTLENTEARISHLQNFSVELYNLFDPDTLVESLSLSQVQMAPYARPELRLWRGTSDLPAPGVYQVVVRFTCEDVTYTFETLLWV